MNIFKQFVMSLYSPKTIAMFRFQKIGKTIGYVFVMMLISFIFIGINIAVSITNAVNEFDNALKEDIPNFQFQNGELNSDISEPIIRQDGNQTIIFDTTGTITRDDLDQYSDAIAVLDDRLIVVTAGSADSFDYGMMRDVNFQKSDIVNFLNSANTLLPLIISVIILISYIFMTALKFIGITILALIGLIVKNIMKRKISYGQLWILSAYSVTLPTLFFAIIDALRITIPGQFFLYWAVAIFFLSQVIKFVPLPKPKETE
ncbi:DUF1189 domain-containing protein [Pseudalkalibacillus salsuginis]|uniref:DUF1189 domain-containing protein n=1 Tax=Pseudalkalibacillus salsuginis TaxID=2910972 RepID=UPI001F1B8042|nr:DUF1189 domain-containing protein [Pseudalkalibacillus salsuginis]MCF6408493.1 DUF1189 domain-containing protein [Pseudalkalibacillus salsuginis]